MDSCMLCEELLDEDHQEVLETVKDTYPFNFTRYPGMCPYCCLDIDEGIKEYKRLNITVI